MDEISAIPAREGPQVPNNACPIADPIRPAIILAIQPMLLPLPVIAPAITPIIAPTINDQSQAMIIPPFY